MENWRSTTPPSRLDPEEVAMFRIIRWPLLALALIVIGAWPAAATPIALAGAGVATLLAAIPGPALLLLAAVAVWRMHRPAPTATA